MSEIGRYTKEQVSKMSYGFLIRAIICNELDLREELNSLDGQGGPYSGEKDMRRYIREKYEPTIKQLTEEFGDRMGKFDNRIRQIENLVRTITPFV
jgi:hypothetical protein